MVGRTGAHRRGLTYGVRTFCRRYGWRAYALPILVAITVGALMNAGTSRPAAATSRQRVPARVDAAPAQHASTTHRARPADQHAAAPAELLWQSTESMACRHNTAPSFVLVSISRQHVWACHGQRQVYSSAATTGASAVDGDATPTGSWVVQGKQRDRYLVGPGYRDYVHYWIPFNGDYGFHDATWQTMRFGAPGYPTKGSHGCVHLPMTAVAWLYRWATIGSTVVTVES